ncbi:GPR1/FUN34/YaaH family transporter [Rugosimonospora acidiphila]|uniref:GPR1/FUN34/YaaH family transporter n=1 Tax=Rugosimonospora acidiphila TaxID=556531 RepID=A0ABP9RR16_9ACTN
MDGGEFSFWRDHTTISLSPVAAPSVLGLFGFAGATFIVAANLAGWYGSTTTTPTFLFPFAAMFGGLAQFLAGMWAYRARDTLATAMHGTWGSFWLGYGILYLLVAVHVLVPPTPFRALGFWFIALAAITWSGTVAALAVNLSLASVLATLAAGATCEAVGMISGSSAWRTTGAYIFIASAVLGWYTATAIMFESTFKRVVLPVGRVGGSTNRPGGLPGEPIQYRAGEPGVKIGQ